MTGVGVLGSRIFRNLFGTDEIRQIFADEAYLAYCVRVEVALAEAQAKIGVIPKEAAAIIAEKANAPSLDIDEIGAQTEIVGYPILPLVRQLADQCGDAGKYVHWGATTQDIMDTASKLQMRDGLVIVERLMESIIGHLERLSQEHKDTPMAGRTHMQHALPVTFGYKCAVWLSGLYRHRERLFQLKPRCLVVQFGGAAGTLASLGSGDEGSLVHGEMAIQLGLGYTTIPWHVARDVVAEIINFLALVGGTLGKIALDIIIMSSNELSEVAEPFVPHRGASSTMPQKRNPISSELMLAASKILRSNASLTLDAMVSDFERASGPWHLEWIAVPESFIIAVGSLHQADFVLSDLVVNKEAMLSNLNSTKGLIVGEAVMMGLAPKMGRQTAHDVVYEACKSAIEEKMSLFETLKKQPKVTEALNDEELRKLCEPTNYLGSSRRMINCELHLNRQA